MPGDRLDGRKSPADGTGLRGFKALEMWRIVADVAVGQPLCRLTIPSAV